MDLPASIYRVGLFHRNGLTLWDSQWYGGHWTLSYSVIFPPLAGLVGVQVTEVLSAAAAAWAFDRLVRGHFGETARFGSLIFAVGTLAQVAIGQLPFLLGEAIALCAFLAASRRRWWLGVLLAVAASLASPLAGAFLLLALVSWLLTSWPRHRVSLGLMIGAATVPVVVLGVLFPGQGFMPFPAIDFVWLVVLFVAISIWVPRQERALRTAVYLYVTAAVLSFFLPTPMGGNISRLAECVGGPLAACALWSHRRRVLAAAVVPLVLMQWVPAFGDLATAQTRSIHPCSILPAPAGLPRPARQSRRKGRNRSDPVALGSGVRRPDGSPGPGLGAATGHGRQPDLLPGRRAQCRDVPGLAPRQRRAIRGRAGCRARLGRGRRRPVDRGRRSGPAPGVA